MFPCPYRFNLLSLVPKALGTQRLVLLLAIERGIEPSENILQFRFAIPHNTLLQMEAMEVGKTCAPSSQSFQIGRCKVQCRNLRPGAKDQSTPGHERESGQRVWGDAGDIDHEERRPCSIELVRIRPALK